MLRTMPPLETFRTEMRRRVCARCHLRPLHSESLGPEAVRPCEQSCPLFVHLPLLRKVAVLADPMIHPRRDAVRQWIAQACDPEGDGAAPGCPLNRYRREVERGVMEIVGDG
jgi:hypothetical protein